MSTNFIYPNIEFMRHNLEPWPSVIIYVQESAHCQPR